MAASIASMSMTMDPMPGVVSTEQPQQRYTALPSETELALLCLDHLRDLRRSQQQHGLQQDYLTIACWALNRAVFTENDAYFTPTTVKHNSNNSKNELPTLSAMEREIIYSPGGENDNDDDEHDDDQDEKKSDVPQHSYSNSYTYDDSHPSNQYRYYPAAGLASTEPLTLGELVTAGLWGWGARSRLEAERGMVHTNPLFEPFVRAVHSKGFFTHNYDEQYTKVVAKFRHKMAAQQPYYESPGIRAAEAFMEERYRCLEQQQHDTAVVYLADLPVPAQYAVQTGRWVPVMNSSTAATPSVPASIPARALSMDSLDGMVVVPAPTATTTATLETSPEDLEQAEQFKTEGNTHMQRKEYALAAECYTKALQCSPAGVQSHVYFSNRAAALVSMKQFDQAIQDSERSLALKPSYGKAHARLGLAHFLLGNYRPAVEAYTVALQYEPNNMSSKNYLERAAKRLAETGETQSTATPTSFSVVSEWDKKSTAEHYKQTANAYMAAREYQKAYDAYTKAIACTTNGNSSTSNKSQHVYYANRAAALCYLERYGDAEQDALQSLQLQPTYGKAYARLGLCRFFLKDYTGAIAAYQQALQYDPQNAASQSYLKKAQQKVWEQQQQQAQAQQ